MTDPITAHFTLTKAEMAEGITQASATLLTSWHRGITSAWVIITAVLAGAGCVGIAIATHRAATGAFPPPIIAPILFAAAGFGVLLQTRVVLGWMAARAIGLGDPNGNHMEIDASGLHIWAADDDRRLGWPAIHSITMGKTALFFNISGAAVVLPKRVLDNPQATFDQAQKWKAAHA